jgi:hypothetical protein
VQISEFEQEKEKEEEEVKAENTRELFNVEADHHIVSGVAYLPSSDPPLIRLSIPSPDSG